MKFSPKIAIMGLATMAFSVFSISILHAALNIPSTPIKIVVPQTTLIPPPSTVLVTPKSPDSASSTTTLDNTAPVTGNVTPLVNIVTPANGSEIIVPVGGTPPLVNLAKPSIHDLTLNTVFFDPKIVTTSTPLTFSFHYDNFKGDTLLSVALLQDTTQLMFVPATGGKDDKNLNVVQNWTFTNPGTGTQTITWNGTLDNSSKKAPPGTYIFTVKGHDANYVVKSQTIKFYILPQIPVVSNLALVNSASLAGSLSLSLSNMVLMQYLPVATMNGLFINFDFHKNGISLANPADQTVLPASQANLLIFNDSIKNLLPGKSLNLATLAPSVKDLFPSKDGLSVEALKKLLPVTGVIGALKILKNLPADSQTFQYKITGIDDGQAVMMLAVAMDNVSRNSYFVGAYPVSNDGTYFINWDGKADARDKTSKSRAPAGQYQLLLVAYQVAGKKDVADYPFAILHSELFQLKAPVSVLKATP